MPGTNNGFDGRQFAKIVALLDSAQDAEATGALHRIRVLLKKHGLTVYQAVEDHDYKTAIWEAFAQPECLREYFERKQGGNEAQLREDVTRLQAALAARERDMVELIDRYEAKLAQVASGARKRRQYHRGVGEFLGYTWGFAQWRMVALLVLVAAHVRTAGTLPRWAALLFTVTEAWVFLLWCAAEIDESGWGQLVIKFAIIGAGGAAVHAKPEFALAILAGVTLVGATRLINNLSDRLMGIPAIATVVGWFA